MDDPVTRARVIGITILCINWLVPFLLGIAASAIYRRRVSDAPAPWMVFLPKFTWRFFTDVP